MIKKFLAKVYRFIVNGNSAVIYFYTLSKYKHQKIYRFCPCLLWIYLLFLVIKYRVFKADLQKTLPVDEGKFKLYPEKDRLLKKIAKADVVSFDVFDTLLLRKFSDPTDVFCIAGDSLKINNYKSKRIFAEQFARSLSVCGEVTLTDICDLEKQLYGIDPSVAYKAELEAETRVCTANPYFEEIFRSDKIKGKHIIAVSDMYLPSSFIRRLLSSCGFKIDDIYVSCEHGCSKANGKLWRVVKENFREKRILHIGDNYVADMKMCGKAGIDFYGVPNLNSALVPFRNFGVNSTVSSIYKAQVNRLHAVSGELSPYYWQGYIYGGILAYGFCQWLDKLAKDRHYDLLLFTARDSKTFYEVYQKYFGDIKAEYLYISRFAALKLALEKNFDMYFDIMFRAKACRKNKITVGQALAQAEIAFLTDKLYLYDLSEKTLLNEATLASLFKCLTENKEMITDAYTSDRQAFGTYITPMIAGAKRVCVIDLGWRGTVYSLLNDYMAAARLDIELEGAMVGTSDDPLPNGLLERGKLHSYAFSNRHNVNFKVNEKRIVLLEVMFSDSTPSVTGYALDEYGAPHPVYGESEGNDARYFKDIRGGIYDFCEQFDEDLKILGYSASITGAETFGPIANLIDHRKGYSLISPILKISLEPNSASKVIKKI